MDRELPISPWPEWEIVEKVGEGSFGAVYKAERTEQGHSFYSAIKIITIPGTREELNSVRQETGDDGSTRKYFENVMQECIHEISTMEYFRGNSFIVSVEDFKVTEYLDEIGWDIFIRMEYLTSLLDYQEEHSFGEEQVRKLGIDLCRALIYCRSLNIIHRDIKPENIFVSRFGDFKLGDFGIARELERSVSGFSKKGTYSYMAPEMYRGEAYDSTVDIYSLGLVLYRLLNMNRLPFLSLSKQLITYRDKENALAERMSGAEIPAPAKAGDAFAGIIRKACAFDPKDRYQSAEEMLRDLEGTEKPDSLTDRGSKESGRQSGKNTERGPEGQESVKDADAGTAGQHLREEEQPAEPSEEKEKTTDDKAAKKKAGKKKGRKKLKKSLPWILTVILGLLIIGILVFVISGYLKKIVEDTVREQTGRMVTSIESQNTVSEDETSQDFQTSIDLISQRATAIANELASYRVKGTEGERIAYYNQDNEIRRLLVYPSFSEDGLYEEYYYWNETLFFAYIWGDNGNEETEEMFYYRDGILIRWIDSDGVTHDNEQDNSEYVELGDKYWLNSILYLI